MHWSLKCGKKMAALCDESVEEHQLADPADDTGQNSWNVSQTRILISYFKENAILWDKRLKDNGNKAKTKKTMVPLIARFGNTQPPRGLKEIKSRWHSVRSSVLRYMKKGKEDPEYEVKWTFWGDLEFLLSSLELSEANEAQGEWSSEEIGKPCTLFQSEDLLNFILMKHRS